MNMDFKKIGPSITANELQKLKSKEAEKNRWFAIQNIIKEIYNEVINVAKYKEETKFVYDPSRRGEKTEKFIIDNKTDFIKSLEQLFPNSSIHYRSFALGKKSKMCDVTDIDEEIKKSLNLKTMIVVDWSA